jgi:hypothetical protein
LDKVGQWTSNQSAKSKEQKQNQRSKLKRESQSLIFELSFDF